MLITELQSLLDELKTKHGTYATVSISNASGTNRLQTYIADDNFPHHRYHPSLADAVDRLKRFVEVDDLLTYNRNALVLELDQKIEEMSDLQYNIDELKRKLGRFKNG